MSKTKKFLKKGKMFDVKENNTENDGIEFQVSEPISGKPVSTICRIKNSDADNEIAKYIFPFDNNPKEQLKDHIVEIVKNDFLYKDLQCNDGDLKFEDSVDFYDPFGLQRNS